MGNSRRFDQQYIVNLTKQLMGASALFRLAADHLSNPRAMYLFFFEKLKDKVRVMNAETLGIICEFAYAKNFSERSSGGFIRKTGIEEVHPHPFDVKAGRELLEEIAIATIVCVARDIVKQHDYEINRVIDQEEDDLFDRGMREYLHRGSNARQL